MLSNREIKWVNSLKNKKYRLKHRAYIAEGPRLVNDLLLNGQMPIKIFSTGESALAKNLREGVVQEVTSKELKKITGLVQPQGLLGVFDMPEEAEAEPHPSNTWGVALDFIQDPGNLGTILRTLAWLDIERIYVSRDSVDVFNPKAVQASMGAVGRVQVRYIDLSEYLSAQGSAIYAAEMQGEPINSISLEPGIIVLGNEGRGISPEVSKHCGRSISIPRLGSGESLNIAISVAIIAGYIKLGQAI